MIKTVRRRFVLAGMTATSVMTITLILALNLVNMYFTDQRLGEALSVIADAWQENQDKIPGSLTNQRNLDSQTEDGDLFDISSDSITSDEEFSAQTDDANFFENSSYELSSDEDSSAQTDDTNLFGNSSDKISSDEKFSAQTDDGDSSDISERKAYCRKLADGDSSGQSRSGKSTYGRGRKNNTKNRSGRMGAFAQYQGRAFSIYLPNEGGYIVNGFNQELLSEIDMENLIKEAEKSGKTRGSVDDFRFLLQEQEEGRLFIFLDCLTEANAQKTLWGISSAIALLGLTAAYLFIRHMSAKSTRPLEESLEKQKRFITDAGHELKTPLAVIGTNMDVLALDLGKNEWVDGTKRQVKKLRKLVENLITLSRLEEDQYAPVPEPFDLSCAVEECVTPFADLAQTKGKYLHPELEDGLSLIGDEAAVRRLVTILCDNAVKYALPEKEIQVRLYRSQKKIIFETRNAWNHSLPPEELDRLFDRFFRTDSSRDRSSSQDSYGLGLSIAKAVAEKNRIALKVFEDEKGLLTFQASFKM